MLEVGQRLVAAQVDASGQWWARVTPGPELADRGGWIYGMVRKRDATTYFRMNVLDATASQAVEFDELPKHSALRRR